MSWEIEVEGAVFEKLEEPIDGMVVRVSIVGGGFVERAVPPAGRVGDVPLRRIAVSPDGGGIVGFLDAEPADGARLAVGYLGEVEVETDFAYRHGGEA